MTTATIRSHDQLRAPRQNSAEARCIRAFDYHHQVVDPIVVAQMRLQPHHQPTGVTRHYFGTPGGTRVEVPRPISLQVVQYPGDEPGAYLFYCDESGEEMTDTYHDSVEEAFEQASAEFGVLRHEWARRSHNA